MLYEQDKREYYGFRHSCASLHINNVANVTYLGHTKIQETLNTYSHMFSTVLDSVVSVIDSLEDDYAFLFKKPPNGGALKK